MACCKDINIGQLRTTVQFQRATRTSDGAGGYTEVWSNLKGAPTKAKVKAKSGYERFRSERMEAGAMYAVTARFSSSVKENDVIVFNSKRHNIRFIDNVEMRNKWMIIDVEGGVAT